MKKFFILFTIIALLFAPSAEAETLSESANEAASVSESTNAAPAATSQSGASYSNSTERWGRRGSGAFQMDLMVGFPGYDPSASVSFGGTVQGGIFFVNSLSLMTGLGCSGSWSGSATRIGGYTYYTSTDITSLTIPITLTGAIPIGKSSGIGLYTGPRFNFIVGYKMEVGDESLNLSDMKKKDGFRTTSTSWGFGAYINIKGFHITAEYQGPISQGTEFGRGNVLVGLGFGL